jgi:hypothetical protein
MRGDPGSERVSSEQVDGDSILPWSMNRCLRQIGATVDRWARKHWSAGGGSVLFVAALLLGLVLIVVWGAATIGLPQNPVDATAPLATQVALPQTKDPNDALDPRDRLALQRDLVEYAIDSRTRSWTLLAQVVGAVVLAVGGFFTWRNLRVTQQRLDVDREVQITNRFTQAISQLGAELKDGQPNLEVRLGGIYALERIARDSPRDHWAIMEILTAYVRENASWSRRTNPSNAVEDEVEKPPPPSVDVQTALTVIGRRVVSADPDDRLDLRETNLRSVDLDGAHLEKAILYESHLEWANLGGAHFQGALLLAAHLDNAFVQDADFAGADLSGADLFNVDFASASVKDALLVSVHGLTSKQIAALTDCGARVVQTEPWEPGYPRFEERRIQSAAHRAPPTTP